MGIRERKERDKEKMRKLIHNTALKLFKKRGIENISIRNISELIEYSPATIYIYFKDKDEILNSLRQEFVAEFEAKLKEFDFIKDHFSRLKNIAHLWIDYALQEPQKYRMIFLQGAMLKDDVFFKYINQSVKEGIQQNQILPLPIRDGSITIIAFLHGMSSLAINNKMDIANKTELKDYMVEQVYRFLRQLKGNAI